jgi:hypothetical protein
MEEWWVSAATATGPEDLPGWRRPFKRFRAVPHDVWLMSQPVAFGERSHLWVSDTAVYELPMYPLTNSSRNQGIRLCSAHTHTHTHTHTQFLAISH